MNQTHQIKRRSGRKITSHYVKLPKSPDEYKAGEQLIIRIDGREFHVHVEIDCLSASNDILYVA